MRTCAERLLFVRYWLCRAWLFGILGTGCGFVTAGDAMTKTEQKNLVKQAEAAHLRKLQIWAWYIRGAREMVLRLREHGLCNEPHDFKTTKEDAVVNKATLDLILSSKENVDRFLMEEYEIRFTDHKYDKKGKLMKCRAYFARKVVKYEEI